MRFCSLNEWLAWQESLHSKEIDLGLERVAKVARDLFPLTDMPAVVTVAGTNGKGSVSNIISSIYHQAGYKVGLFTSPHLIHYNERIRINGFPVSDEEICASFDRIDKARNDISLTYFEFGTLAALDIFYRKALDVVILEVGLGGRLDAVNIVDPDVAVITSIDLDHQSWLGNDRESIAKEKLGICRPNTPLVVGELSPPKAIESHCIEHKVPLYRIRHEFAYQSQRLEQESQLRQWQWLDKEEKLNALPVPKLNGEHQLINSSVAIMATRLLQKDLPVSLSEIRKGLLSVNLEGRVQHIQDGDRHIVIDVAHNPQSAQALYDSLRTMNVMGRRIAILGMLKDKDVEQTIRPLLDLVDYWYLVDLPTSRGASASDLFEQLRSNGIAEKQIEQCANVSKAYSSYKSQSQADDLLVIFGSFITAADALTLLAN